MISNLRGHVWLNARQVLHFNIRALVDCEAQSGVRTQDLASAIFERGSVAALRSMIWAASLHCRPGLSIHEAGELIECIGIDFAREAVAAGLAAAFGAPDEGSGDQSAGGWNWMKTHEAYCEAGGISSDFWIETPALVRSVIRASAARLGHQYKIAMSQAWHAASIPHMAGGWPALADLIGDHREVDEEAEIRKLDALLDRAERHWRHESHFGKNH